MDFIPAREVLVIEQESSKEEEVEGEEEDQETASREKSKEAVSKKKKKTNKLPKERRKSGEGVIREALRRSKSDLELGSQARPAAAASSASRPPATISRAQSVYKVNSSGSSCPARPPLITAPLASQPVVVGEAAVATFPCTSSSYASPLLKNNLAKVTTAANSTYPRRRPSEFDGRQCSGPLFEGRQGSVSPFGGRDPWRNDSTGFIQVADLELVAELKKENEENLWGRTEDKMEEEEEFYQTPKHPVPVGVGKNKLCKLSSVMVLWYYGC